MYDICEAIELLNSLTNIDEQLYPFYDRVVINIDSYITPSIDEDLPSGNIDDVYDDNTIEEWEDFISNVEEIIEWEFKFKIVNNATSKKAHKFSHYINFFITDDEGNIKKECVINFRLSDHKSTSSVRTNRLRHIKNDIKNSDYPESNYQLAGITVNGKSFKDYNQVLKVVRNKLKDLKDTIINSDVD